MALDPNLKNIPITGDFAVRDNTGETYLRGLVADSTISLSGTHNFLNGWADGDVDTTAVDGAYPVAIVDVSGRLAKTNKSSYSLATSTLTVPALTVYGSRGLNVSSNTNVSGELVVTGTTVHKGTVSSIKDLTVSASITTIDAEGHALVMRRDDDASYENLIKAYDGTLTLQAEDDVHLKSNTGEDFARFNENAAVWLYHNDVKKLETATDGVYTSGEARNTEGVTTSSNHSVAIFDSSIPTLSDFRQPHGAGSFFWASSVGNGTNTASEVKFGEGTTLQGTSSVGRTGANNTNGFYLWDETNDKLDVSSTGIYRIVWTAACTVDTNTNSVFKIYTNGSLAYTQTYRIHTVTDPHVISLDWVGPITAGADAIYVTALANTEGTITLTINSASTLFVQRLA